MQNIDMGKCFMFMGYACKLPSFTDPHSYSNYSNLGVMSKLLANS